MAVIEHCVVGDLPLSASIALQGKLVLLRSSDDHNVLKKKAWEGLN